MKIKVLNFPTLSFILSFLTLWKTHLQLSWIESILLMLVYHSPITDLGMGSLTSLHMSIRNILTFLSSFQYFHALIQTHHLQRNHLLPSCSSIWLPNYHLNQQSCTLIALAFMTIARNFLPLCDHRLIDFLGMQIFLSQSMFQPDSISTFNLLF